MSEIDLLESKQNKLVINIFGAPGVGKSTLAKNLQEFMQKQGYGSYLVEEFATKLIKENRIDELKDQIFVSQNQANMIKFGLDQSNLVICDSPLQLGKIYNSDYTKANKVSNLIDYAEKNYTSIDLFLQHDSQTEKTYTMQGRVHTLEESKFKEKELLAILHGKKLIFASRDMDLETLFIKIKNTDEFKNFTKELKMEKEKLINLYKENNAEHFQNEERFKKIGEEISIEMGDPYGEYRYEVKGNQMKENQKNEELAIYSFRDEFGGYDDEREQYFGTEFYFENYDEFKAEQEKRRITDDVTYKETDLIVIKNITAKRHDYYEDTNTDYNISDKFEKKVDQHLIYHICDKFYTDDNDRQFFKQNKIAYDDNGFIQKIQAIGDGNWVDIKVFRNVEELEKYFSESKNVKQENEVKQQQPTEKENNKNEELAIYSVEHDIVGLQTPDEGFFTTYFRSKENAEKFISENLFDPENGYKEYDNALFYDENFNVEEPKKITDDLIEMKKIARNENANGRNGEFYDFEKKVDEKLIQHICDKYYSGYENAEKDQKFFKENKIDYDENGFIKGVQAISDNDWLDILSAKNIDSLDTLFKNEYFAKKHNLYEICDLLDDGLGTSERRVGFFSKDEIKDFIAKDETGVTTRTYEYKIYNSDGDVTEALKNEVRNELLNQNSEFEESNETNHKRKRR